MATVIMVTNQILKYKNDHSITTLEQNFMKPCVNHH